MLFTLSMYCEKREEDFEGDALRKKLYLDVRATVAKGARPPERNRLFTLLDGELLLPEEADDGENGKDIKVRSVVSGLIN